MFLEETEVFRFWADQEIKGGMLEGCYRAV